MVSPKLTYRHSNVTVEQIRISAVEGRSLLDVGGRELTIAETLAACRDFEKAGIHYVLVGECDNRAVNGKCQGHP